MYWRRASIQDGPSVHISVRQVDAAVRKRFFRDNFVIFRCRSKRITFLESVNYSVCVCMRIFNFHDGHVTTFRHPSGAYICQMPGPRLSRLAKGTPSESRGFPSVGLPLVWGKTVSCRLCARIAYQKGTLKTRKSCFLDLALPTLQNSGIFHNSTRPQKIITKQSFWFGLEPPTRRSRSKSAHSVQQMCAKFYPDRLRFGSMRAKSLFLSKNSKTINFNPYNCRC